MKKITCKIASVALIAGLVASGFTGCKKDDNLDYDINDYVKTLGAYTGLTVDEVTTIATDEDVQSELDSLVSQNTTYADVTDRGIQDGDTVTLSYTKTVNGEEADTQTDFTMTMGNYALGEEFETNIMGMAVNESKAFDVQEEVAAESDDDADTNTEVEVSGDLEVESSASGEDSTETTVQTATYSVTITGIQEEVVPEVTDEFISENTDYATIDEYKAGTKEELQKKNEESAKQTAELDLLQQVVDASDVTGCPTGLFNLNYNTLCKNYAQYASYFGTDLEGYLSAAGMSLDDIKKSAAEATEQYMVVEAICKDAGLEPSDDEYNEKVEQYVEEYGYESKEAFTSQFSKEEILMDIRKEVVFDYLYENNTVNKSTTEE